MFIEQLKLMRNNFSALARAAQPEEAKRPAEEEAKVPAKDPEESSFINDLNQLVIQSTTPLVTT